MLGLHVEQRFKIGIDRDAYGTLIPRNKVKRMATAMRKSNPYQQTIAFLETSVAENWARDE